MLQPWQLELQMFGNISLKSSSVNHLEMPSPGVKSQEGPAALQISEGAAGEGEGRGDGPGAGTDEGEGTGVGAGIGSGGASLHLHRPSRLQGHQLWPPRAQGAQ
mmetsp:Transcript_75060/g.207016  ORF Transcript_75060/g.207016 Transcript_75060/m.207016 type:complete len:104 (+) Transcript_75060:1289-1600(+)